MNDCIGRCKGSVNAWVNAVPLVWKYPLYAGLAKVLKAETGLDFTEEELSNTGRRVYLLELAINALRGIKRKDNRLVQRPELRDTPQGETERKQFDEMIDEYYKRRGCTIETSVPTREALESLSLSFAADALEKPHPETWVGPPLWPIEKYPFGGKRS